MSEDKLDRIEKRVNQLVDMFGKMIGTVTKINGDITEMKGDINEIKIDVKRLDGKTDDIAREVLDLQKVHNEFKQETRQNFERVEQNFVDVKSELRFMNRKSAVLANDVVEVRASINDVENRVDELKRKDAA